MCCFCYILHFFQFHSKQQVWNKISITRIFWWQIVCGVWNGWFFAVVIWRSNDFGVGGCWTCWIGHLCVCADWDALNWVGGGWWDKRGKFNNNNNNWFAHFLKMSCIISRDDKFVLWNWPWMIFEETTKKREARFIFSVIWNVGK